MSIGSSRAPSATIVTPDAPVRAVNKAQAMKPTMARPAGIRTEQRLDQRHQSLRGLGLGHQVAGEGEERQRRQELLVRQVVDVDRHRGEVDADRHEPQHGRRQHHREQRRAEERHQDDQGDARPDHCASLGRGQIA